MKDSKQDIVQFWFEEATPRQWFQVSPEFDQQIKDRFSTLYDMAAQGLCEEWKRDVQGCLALCLVLDQFPRNMFRGSAKAFATDKEALLLSKQAIHRGYDQVLPAIRRRFLYMPFMHSENLPDQRRSLELFGKMQAEDPLGYEHARRHCHEIERFHRFPYRNKVLGRENTPEEDEYLSAFAA
jgi:uncharacterized protein (DUF924 family)